MAEGKLIFEYIKSYYSQAIDYLKNNKFLYIYGEPKIGKTYLAQLCLEKVSNAEYFKLHLKAYDGYNPNYYTFQIGLNQSDAIYETGKEFASDLINNSDNRYVKVIDNLLKLISSYQQKCFSCLSESDISVINRISFHCKNRSLYLVADDYGKWDEASKNLIRFFMTPEAQEKIPFLDHCRIIFVGEKETEIELLKVQYNNIKTINIKGYAEKDTFIREFLEIKKCSFHLAETLYQITNGNLGMAFDISFYMGEQFNLGSSFYELGEYKAKKLFLSVIDERVRSIDQATPQFVTTIKAASIQGNMFNQKYLPDIVGGDEFAVDRVLSLAKQEHFLALVQKENFLYSFINNYIYQYFDEHFNEYRKEYHYKFACAAKKVHAGDYYTQYLHLRAAEKRFESAENLVVHLAGQKLRNNITDSKLLDYLKEVSMDLYNNYMTISQSIDLFYEGLHRKAIMKLELVMPVSEIVLLEKEYLTAYFIYDGWIHERNTEACDMLVNNFETLLEHNFDMWLRSSLLLYIYYVNRLHNALAARNVEKKIMKEIAKRYRDDSSLEIIVHILERNASALYSTEVALLKCRKSVDYFMNYAYALCLEYIYALINYSGLLLVASEYNEGFLYAQKAVTLISEKKIWIKDLGKVINNYLVNGVMSQNINYNYALEICESLMRDNPYHKSVLLKSNYYIFRAFAGFYNGLLNEIGELFWSDSVQKHNDYYVYLIGTNYICISIIIGKFSLAQSIYEELKEMVPAICINEEYIIKKRYEIFKEIIATANPACTSLKSLEEYFNKNMADIESDYAKKPYILTDQQFWSVI